ncbi:MAG: redox-regulated ATPase YchF [Planctomycetes bacterium]|nr:redox-regulated ATPase YchF [Planctomycetota bacterium]
MRLGFVGLPVSGKTTVFETLSGDAASAEHHGPTMARIASVKVPDERLDFLQELFQPKKVTHAAIDFVDIPGIISETGREENSRILASLREADALIHVVRLFESEAAPHPRQSVDPKRDIDEVESEMAFADLAIAEARIEKLEVSVKKSTPEQEREKKELEVLMRCRDALENGSKLIGLGLSDQKLKLLSSYCFLTLKPEVLLLNIGEGDVGNDSILEKARDWPGEAIAMCAQVEMEIAALDSEEDRRTFLAEMNITEPAADKLKAAAYRALGVATFFTTVSDELRAWTVRQGDDAVTAAGKIHTDISRGFIRAEVVSVNDLKELGSMKEAKAKGKLRLEGKDYIVQDGDVVFFRFSK